MQETLEQCRWLYNHLLEQRRNAYEQTGKGLSLYDQHGTLPELKHGRTELTIVHSQVLQNVAVRIDLAFKAFFRRVKAGETPGYPRFRGRDRYDSFMYPQWDKSCKIEGDRIYLPKIGHVRIVLHRPLQGTPKTCTLRRTPTGKWFATIVCETEAAPLPPLATQVGVDVGLHSFATLSTGEAIDNPRFFRRGEKALKKAQRRLSKETKGTPAYRKRKRVMAHVHERIASQRRDFAHQQSRILVNRFGLIAVEDIQVNRMVHNHCLAKSIHDAGWSEFLQYLSYKAADAGREFAATNPAYTSQTCSRCGHRQPMPLSERVFTCPCCGLELGRDHNASLNILALGLQSLGESPRSSRL